ncbi:Clavaminate synthase-like protein [Lepidopterella palustris CBS 459.81]|uniref:Clavaminate synthase-like protein n=1 Tax=Lepidopterella palustris CBS 459.81 TaxID=1314670 RepID=A0A8E2E502_9PEZI|nr:Clavaminate synthase-like protein [Lepidopterella palustris CBS 459.81]
MAAAVASHQIAQPTDETTLNEARSGAHAYLQSRLASKPAALKQEPFEIPIIDISPSFSTCLSDRKGVAAEIRSACLTSGFFYITNHGVPLPTCSAILREAQRFFKTLPREKKEAMHLRNSKLGYGWEPSEYTSIAGDVETKEGFNFGYEEGLDKTGGDGLYKNLDGTTYKGNMWPEESDLPGFYAVVREYYSEVLQLARHLFRLFALSLSLPETHFDPMTTHPGGIARLLYYPPAKRPVPSSPHPSAAAEEIGLGAHSDYECFTLLLCSSSPGLEILSPTGTWTAAPPIPGSFIVNVADFLMRWTNGVYKSTVHRVVNRSKEERYSVPFFFSVNYDVVIETLPGCVEEGGRAMYPPIRAGEYILERLNTTTKDGKGYYGNEAVF